MTKENTAKTWMSILALLGLAGISAAGLYQYWLQIQANDLLDLSASLRLQATLAAGGVWVLACLIALVTIWAVGAETALEKLSGILARLAAVRRLSWLVYIFLLGLFVYLVMGRYSLHLADFWVRLTVLLAFLVLSIGLLRIRYQDLAWPVLVSLALLGFGFTAFIAEFIPQVTSYPFSLGWSEISRYYNGSLYLSEKIYSFKAPLPHRDFTRYLMQAVPYLFSGVGLWGHRFWQAALRVGLSLLAAYALARRLTGRKRALVLFMVWGALFLRQGPVFYPMLVILIGIFLGYDAKRFWRSTLLVLLVSVWAGLTRINWIPMPALLASLLYIMETPWEGKGFKAFMRYVWPTGFWLLSGAAAALAARWIYQVNSGLPVQLFASDFSSDLLWYRLLPNVNYHPGVVTGVLAVTAPLLVFAVLTLRRSAQSLHPMRHLGIWGIIAGLFLGGTLVSAKIGGGANMHNMDVYLVVLLALCAYLYFEGVRLDLPGRPLRPALNGWGLLVVMAAPAFFHVFQLQPYPQRDFELADFYVQRIQEYIEEAAPNNEEVLFVAQRHLVTFGYLEDVALVPEYEQLLLMEMAMGGNPEYLEAFQTDLENHRFALIFTDIIIERYKQPQEDVFAEENNVYSQNVVHPLMCSYQSLKRLRSISLELWVPREKNICK